MLIHSWHMIKELNPGLSEFSLQQNATDFTCDKLNKINGDIFNPSLILKDKTVHNTQKDEVPLTETFMGDKTYEGWYLSPGIYEMFSDIWVEIPPGQAGWVIHRSSLNRNGTMVVASLYDSGFNGHLSATIYVLNPTGIFIEKGARVGQLVLAQAETLNLYQGQYQSEKRT